MVGDVAKEILIANFRELKYSPRGYVNYNGLPVNQGETPDVNPDVICADLDGNVQYEPLDKYGRMRSEVFKVVMPVMGSKTVWRFMSWKDFCYLCKNNKKLKFVKENFTISETHFIVAAQNPGFRVPFCLDVEKYDKKLREIAGIGPHELSCMYNPYRKIDGKF